MKIIRPVLLAAWLLWFPGVGWSGMESGVQGNGLYGNEWTPDPMHEYWDPGAFHQPEKEQMEGVYQAAECIECHEGVTPGIVKGWKTSRHASPKGGKPSVGCDTCHGNDHQALVFPTPETCGTCHGSQHADVLDERRFGFPSHALAMERAVDAKHFVDKPKAEVLSCLQCHSVATKCDSCHTRHRFDAAEARRPEACLTCHSGPPHPDDETFFNSAHGKLYQEEGATWDWNQPLRKGNYKAPTCAYCHMRDGKHQVADKPIWKFGIREVNPLTPQNRVRRKRWIELCTDCHPQDRSQKWLAELDEERKRAWKKLYEAEDLLKGLRWKGLFNPDAGERPPYPTDWLDTKWPRVRIGFYEGQASAFYNVSPIERDYFEMWYFDNLRAFKGAAHGSPDHVREGHEHMDQALKKIHEEANILRRLRTEEKDGGVDPRPVWLRGEYTEFNQDQN